MRQNFSIRLSMLILLVMFLLAGCTSVSKETAVSTETETTIEPRTKINRVEYPVLTETYEFTMPAAKIECLETAEQPSYIFCQSTTNPGSSSGLWIKEGDKILAVDLAAKGHGLTMGMESYEQAGDVDVLPIYKSFRTD